MDVDLNKISFLRRDRAYNFRVIDEVYEEITQRNVVYESEGVERKSVSEEEVIVVSEPVSVSECGSDLLHSAPSSNSNREPFNFLCTFPYTTDIEFDKSIEKILNMQGRDDPVMSEGVQSSAHMMKESSEEFRYNYNGQGQGQGAVKATDAGDVGDTISTSIVAENYDVVVPSTSLENSIAEVDYSAVSSLLDVDPVHRISKYDIPQDVRSALSLGIAQQRAGGESLESEQVRRLNEFSLWRRNLMSSCVPPTVPPPAVSP